MSQHFLVGTAVVTPVRRRGTVTERDGRGGMVVQWDDGEVSAVQPFALAHES